MPVTVQSIVDQALIELSQVPGSSTQIYGTPRVLTYVQDVFDMVFQASWWNAYSTFVTGTLDGVTGLLTADIIPSGPVFVNSTAWPINDYTNIRSCFPDNSNKIIRELPPRTNPFLYASSGGPIYKTQDNTFPNRPIKFYPITATGNVIMEVRQNPPHPFALTDLIYIDPLMLVLGTCYLYAADDGTNPGQINKFQSTFMKRMSDMIAAEGDTVVQLDPRFGVEQDQWWEYY